jgi:transcriptional regulator with XRE-family HTH domain
VNLVRDLRLSAGLTKELLGKAAGTTGSVICAYERGRRSPTLRTLFRIADAVGLEMQVSFVPAAEPHTEDYKAPATLTDPRTTDPVAAPTEASGSIGTDYVATIERYK